MFAAPWEAQAFAMGVELHARGAFTWKEWSAALGSEIASENESDGGGSAKPYYEHWLAALEGLVTEKRLTSAADLATRKAAWKAAERPPLTANPSCSMRPRGPWKVLPTADSGSARRRLSLPPVTRRTGSES